MQTLAPYCAAIKPEWIDYNGHLRDAYYGLVLSHAIDEVMDQLGLDAAYRERTRCTLYTLELHVHYLHEVHGTDELRVESAVLDADRKRIHLGSRFLCPRLPTAVATADAMLLHVDQTGTPTSAAFPSHVDRRLQELKLPRDARDVWGPASRIIEIKRA